jgi:hypothetical protein
MSLIPTFVGALLASLVFAVALVYRPRSRPAPLVLVALAALVAFPVLALAQAGGAVAVAGPQAFDWTVKLGAVYAALQGLAQVALMFTPTHTFVGRAAKWLLAGPSRFQGTP